MNDYWKTHDVEWRQSYVHSGAHTKYKLYVDEVFQDVTIVNVNGTFDLMVLGDFGWYVKNMFLSLKEAMQAGYNLLLSEAS